MTERNNESLSAYVDGDLKDEKFLNTLCNDSELQEKWHRYHIIKDGLKNENLSLLNVDISAQVAQALENEPALSSSKSIKPTSHNAGIVQWLASTFSGKKASNDAAGKFTPIVQQTGQFAVAASVAVAVILGVQQYNQPAENQPFNAAPIIPVTGIQGGLSPVSLEQTRTLPRTDVSAQRQRLNAYLHDHNQQVRRKGTEGTADSSVELDAKDNEKTDQERQNSEK